MHVTLKEAFHIPPGLRLATRYRFLKDYGLPLRFPFFRNQRRLLRRLFRSIAIADSTPSVAIIAVCVTLSLPLSSSRKFKSEILILDSLLSKKVWLVSLPIAFQSHLEKGTFVDKREFQYEGQTLFYVRLSASHCHFNINSLHFNI